MPMSRLIPKTARSPWRSKSSLFFSRELKILGVYPAHPLRIAASSGAE
jgi:hypothetical protein